jgi:type II secretory pathway component PulM
MTATQTRSIVARIMALPPRTRWMLGAIAAVALYVVVDDYCWSTARDLDRQADRLQALLDRGAAMNAPMPREVERAVLAYGIVEPPESEAQSSQALAAAVSEVVKRHNIQNYAFEARSGGKLPSAFSESCRSTLRPVTWPRSSRTSSAALRLMRSRRCA